MGLFDNNSAANGPANYMQNNQSPFGMRNNTLFPQPIGNVYSINSALEAATIPVGAGYSVAICIPENIMYIKTMQNGNPLFHTYKLTPFSGDTDQAASPQTTAPAPANNQTDAMLQTINKIADQMNLYNNKISQIEEQISKLQGNLESSQALPQKPKQQDKGGDWLL